MSTDYLTRRMCCSVGGVHTCCLAPVVQNKGTNITFQLEPTLGLHRLITIELELDVVLLSSLTVCLLFNVIFIPPRLFLTPFFFLFFATAAGRSKHSRRCCTLTQGSRGPRRSTYAWVSCSKSTQTMSQA